MQSLGEITDLIMRDVPEAAGLFLVGLVIAAIAVRVRLLVGQETAGTNK